MVKLLKPYGTYVTGATVILPSDTESALIVQGLATLVVATTQQSLTGSPDQPTTVGGNIARLSQAGQGFPETARVPYTVPCIGLGGAALDSYETDGVAPGAAGTVYLTEIFVPGTMKVSGVGLLTGTVVNTDTAIVALYGSDGSLLANSVLTGSVVDQASVFQGVPFTAPIVIPKGRYFVGMQVDGTTNTYRHLLAANGAPNCTGSVAGTFGTLPATITPPAAFVDATGVICELYT